MDSIYAQRAIRIVLPVALVVLPLLRIIPWLYTWRNRSKFYRWYGELKYLESEVTDHPQPERIPDYRARLDRIEDAVNKVNVPLAFYDEIYTLREHIDFVRGKISRLNQDPIDKVSTL
jgi:phosphoenolpyruvate carboxylase